MVSKKRIGILTSGGDCSGLNSAIRGAYWRAGCLGYELVGIKRGLRGLSFGEPQYCVLRGEDCDERLLLESGSIIYSDTKWAKSAIDNGLSMDDIRGIISTGYEKLGLSGLVYIGGDGSLRLLDQVLAKSDINIVAIPKTIDNDVGETDFAIGFSTAVEVVADSIENIRSTAKSHERVMVVEVMGRDAGFIAMYAGVAAGADAILVPEFPYTMAEIEGVAKKCYESGKNHCIIVVAEAVESDSLKHGEERIDGVVSFSMQRYNGIGENIAESLKNAGFDSRAVVLGHVQRGGKTAIQDRILGSAFGIEAVNLVASENCGRLLCYKAGKITSISIEDAMKNVTKSLSVDDICVSIARGLGVYIGEIS